MGESDSSEERGDTACGGRIRDEVQDAGGTVSYAAEVPRVEGNRIIEDD